MAEIPVHKKGGIPWWLWLLVALVLALLLWWLIPSGEDDDMADGIVTAPAMESGRDPAAGPPGEEVSDMTGLYAPPASLVGRTVDLDNVPVESLAGDRSFYIGESAERRIMVVFEETQTPGTPKEGRIDVNPGSVVSLQGTIVDPGQLPGVIRATIPGGVDAVIRATALDIRGGAAI